MKVAILQCDDVLDKFQPDFGNYPGMVMHMLKQVRDDVSFHTFDVRNNDYPCVLSDWDLYVITGSKTSVYDGSEWIAGLVDCVQRLDEQALKVFGICFGHQIMALAKGGRVEKSDKGWGVGVATNQVIKSAQWMGSEIPANFNLLVSHQDQVVDLPAEVTVLAKSEFCPYFMVQWSRHLLSIQGHPEWCHEYSRGLINDRRHIIPENTVLAAIDSLTQTLDNTLLANWVVSFAKH